MDPIMEIHNIGSAWIAYRRFGSGKQTVVIDTALGSCSAEWWHIAECLGRHNRVLVYDRVGPVHLECSHWKHGHQRSDRHDLYVYYFYGYAIFEKHQDDGRRNQYGDMLIPSTGRLCRDRLCL